MGGTAPREVMPRVWFGPSAVTFRPEEISRFTHILNCSDSRGYTNTWARGSCKFLYLESLDLDDFPILERHLPAAAEFIDRALEDPEAAVYIHCLMGMNRSACLAVAYACLRGGRNLYELVPQLRAEAEYTLTNAGFCAQLMEMFPAATSGAPTLPKSETR